ncbi:MAG: basic rane protein, partial [Chloroflexota bacterium]|nr:basic rane protein [Chloroflexota bacterium]
MDVRRIQPSAHLRHLRRPIALATVALLLLSACGGTGAPSAGGADGDVPKVFGAFATQIEEPWDGVIHSALQAEADDGRIEYT